LASLNITNNQEQAKQIVAAHAVKPAESLSLMGSFEVSDVVKAIDYLESLVKIEVSPNI
jgi:uncharacterized oxidoreductase